MTTGPYRFDYSTLPRRRPTSARPLHLDLEAANRRDARAAELTSPPATTSTGHHAQPWTTATSIGDSA